MSNIFDICKVCFTFGKLNFTIMKSRFLFPTKAKFIGIALFFIGLSFFYYSHQFGREVFVWHNLRPNANSFTGGDQNECFDNELQLSFVLVGLVLIAGSKEKTEDEHIVHLRLESLQWAVYVNYAVFFVLIFATYGFSFLVYSMYNVLTLLVFFILRFRWKIFKNNRLMSEVI